MGRKVAMLWHASFSIGAGVLFFYFALPRWAELVGDVSHAVGIGLRIVTGALIGLAALPVVFTLLRTRKPELGTPQLALSIRTWSIVAHVLAGVLIIGTSISEIWFSLDKAGPWLFAIYGAAAAIAVLGFFAFYLSFVAELPPPPPKPIKPKKAKKSRGRAKRGKGDEADVEDTDDEDDDETDETDEAEDAADSEDSEDSDAEEEKEEEATVEAEADDASDTETTKTVAAPAEVSSQKADRPEPESVTEEETTEEVDEASAETVEAPAAARLRNRRPTGKTSHRRRRTRGGVAVDE